MTQRHPHTKQSSPIDSGLEKFLQEAVTPWHASRILVQQCQAAGFKVLDDSSSWDALQPGQGYVFQKQGSMFAFRHRPQASLRLAYAHTDSPNLRIKMDSDRVDANLRIVGVMVYGGALLNPWFDRPLGIAGRVSTVVDGRLVEGLIQLPGAQAFIPNLAIHLDRTANSEKKVNPQKDMHAVYGLASSKPLLEQVHEHCIDIGMIPNNHPMEALVTELCLFEDRPTQTTGQQQEFLMSARLDNLLSCYVLTQALIHEQGENLPAVACLDHEEIGSASYIGGRGSFIPQLIGKILPDELFVARPNDLGLSLDNAHALNPSYPSFHEPHHAPKMGKGPALKIDANHRYSSTLPAEARVIELAKRAGVELQKFISRGDTSCGSTLGPILSSELGLEVLDMGIPQFAMHSAMESCSWQDVSQTSRLMQAFFEDSIQPVKGKN